LNIRGGFTIHWIKPPFFMSVGEPILFMQTLSYHLKMKQRLFDNIFSSPNKKIKVFRMMLP